MTDRQGPRYLWYRLLLVVGGVLGVLLAVQSIRTYYYVSQGLIREALFREAGRQGALIDRSAQRANESEWANLGELLDGIRKEEPNIAWIRVTDPQGNLLIQSGDPVGEPFSLQKAAEGMDRGGPATEIRETKSGKVLVTTRPVRRLPVFRRPNLERLPQSVGEEQQPNLGIRPPVEVKPIAPGEIPATPEGRSRFRFNEMEIAIYRDSINTNFGDLQHNLIINVSAALALVASMLILGLRFPNYLRGRQLGQQLELARRVQQDLLPPISPNCGSLDFAAQCDPAWHVGGDFYDVFPADHRSRIGMLLGDVSGKGLPAALLMGLLNGAMRSSHWIGDGAIHEEASSNLNKLLCLRTSVEMFASLFWCYYDPEARKLRYVNAGHLPPFVASRNGDGAPKLQRLREGGPVLGVIPSARYQQGEIDFQAGDLMVLYSDGVVEAANAKSEEFGEERLASIILENWQRSSAEIRDTILARVRAFVGREQLQDDLTLLVVRAP